jgi:hypothetical protein
MRFAPAPSAAGVKIGASLAAHRRARAARPTQTNFSALRVHLVHMILYTVSHAPDDNTDTDR